MCGRFWQCFLLARKLARVSLQIVRGYYRLLKVSGPTVSIFGSARAMPSERYAEMADYLAHLFAEENISVITGGGMGIMQAASCGVTRASGKRSSSIGISVRNLKEEKNACLDEFIVLDYFFARKWLLTHYSKAFIVFPGGYGTMDELMEILTLEKTETMAPVPIILIGVEFWQPFVAWLKTEVVHHNYIDAAGLDLFVVTDDLDKAFMIAKGVCLTKEQ